MIILHCLAPAPVGGLESVVRALAVGHQTRGHKILIAAVVDRHDHPVVCGLRDLGIDVVEIHAAARDFRKERRLIEEIIHRKRPDIVHAHGYRPDILDLPVAKRLGVPTVSTLHGFTGGDWKLRMYERLQFRALRHVDAVVAVSQGVYDRVRLKGVPEQRIHLIPNAYAPSTMLKGRDEARAMLQIPDDAFRIGWIGRLSQEKGADVMLNAMAVLRDSPISLSFIGDGPDRETLSTRAEALGVKHQVHMHGMLPDAAHYMSAFDAFVLSSRTEGTPMVVLEAMAAGLPIVATRVGGIPQMLTNAEALLVDSENPMALATATRAVYTDPAAARTRAANARLRQERDFGMEPWLKRYEALYASLSTD